MDQNSYKDISLKDFKWLNEPKVWSISDSVLNVTTDDKTDFWQTTFYDFNHNTGHVYGIDIKDDFTFVVRVESNLDKLYDQAGLMIYLDDKNWIKAGLELSDGMAMIGSVVTKGVSDWAAGVFTQDPRNFWLRLTKRGDVVCIKYSPDIVNWHLLRLCQFPVADKYFVGPMCCTPQRSGLEVRFSEIEVTTPADDILHSN